MRGGTGVCVCVFVSKSVRFQTSSILRLSPLTKIRKTESSDSRSNCAHMLVISQRIDGRGGRPSQTEEFACWPGPSGRPTPRLAVWHGVGRGARALCATATSVPEIARMRRAAQTPACSSHPAPHTFHPPQTSIHLSPLHASLHLTPPFFLLLFFFSPRVSVCS